jgi:Fic family protein
MAVRDDGNWEGWLRFFLRGVVETAEEATITAQAIVRLRESHREQVQDKLPGVNGLRLLDLLFHRPIVNVNLAKDRLGIAYVTASRLIDSFVELGLLKEITGGQRSRIYRYEIYWKLFQET